MRRDALLLLLAAGPVAAADATAPTDATTAATVTTTITAWVEGADRETVAGWKDGAWIITRDNLDLRLTVSAKAARPVLRLRIASLHVHDGTGVDLVRDDTLRQLSPDDAWKASSWETPPGDPLAMNALFFPVCAAPGGSPAQLAQVDGTVQVTLAAGIPQLCTIPIAGPHRQEVLGNTGFQVEVGRERPSLAMPDSLVAHLGSLTIREGGTPHSYDAIAPRDPWVLTLPTPPQDGDTATFTVYPTVTVETVPFKINAKDIQAHLRQEFQRLWGRH